MIRSLLAGVLAFTFVAEANSLKAPFEDEINCHSKAVKLLFNDDVILDTVDTSLSEDAEFNRLETKEQIEVRDAMLAESRASRDLMANNGIVAIESQLVIFQKSGAYSVKFPEGYYKNNPSMHFEVHIPGVTPFYATLARHGNNMAVAAATMPMASTAARVSLELADPTSLQSMMVNHVKEKLIVLLSRGDDFAPEDVKDVLRACIRIQDDGLKQLLRRVLNLTLT